MFESDLCSNDAPHCFQRSTNVLKQVFSKAPEVIHMGYSAMLLIVSLNKCSL